MSRGHHQIPDMSQRSYRVKSRTGLGRELSDGPSRLRQGLAPTDVIFLGGTPRVAGSRRPRACRLVEPGSETEQEFSSSFEHLEGDTPGVISLGVSF
jgi:hypothetical protein